MTRELLQQALNALVPFTTPNWAGPGYAEANEAHKALEVAIAQLVQPDQAVSIDTLVAEFEATPEGADAMENGRRWVKDLAQPVQPADHIADVSKMVIVGYQYQWTNPGNNPDTWTPVIPAEGQTEQERVNDILAHRYGGKPAYRVRALYTPKEIS